MNVIWKSRRTRGGDLLYGVIPDMGLHLCWLRFIKYLATEGCLQMSMTTPGPGALLPAESRCAGELQAGSYSQLLGSSSWWGLRLEAGTPVQVKYKV